MSFSRTRRGTLASIAAEVGVSRTTVSNAYNRPDQLSPQLRERILTTAARMGYPGPDPTARSLRTRHAGAIGVLLTEDMTYAFEDQASLEFVSGVSVACSSMDASMLLIPAGAGAAHDHSDPAARAAQLVSQAAVDGFIVYSVAADDPFLTAVEHRGLPTVICDQPVDARGADFVGIDDRQAIKPAVRHLVEAGHRAIGVLCIRLDRTPNNGPVSTQRLAKAHMHVQRSRVLGVLDVLEEATGQPCTPENVPIVERHINNEATAYSAAEELLTANPDLTAVVCTTDSLALGVAAYAEDSALSIPQDLSLTGFDGIPQATDHGITTVRQPSRTKGLTAGEMLDQRIKEVDAKRSPTARNKPARKVQLDTELVPGSSIAPPRR
ncbi:MAG TPA: LacI family DNA-binding transcriptional regulator [Candidatus Corynebacterium gallistercoris]|uniref:LacI family DNA-binding transcriptional regulator n=1 Tax=Candidatus Corynebacterium gallistercoris TaxID=2838530 RepID=A0A9D1UQF5_9CORY|nr:LacI family DNA-binding transcriptional regulator [Candidatus Corynebacterium gallistercoris]